MESMLTDNGMRLAILGGDWRLHSDPLRLFERGAIGAMLLFGMARAADGLDHDDHGACLSAAYLRTAGAPGKKRLRVSQVKQVTIEVLKASIRRAHTRYQKLI